MLELAASVLVGVLHVHHEPSHDSRAPFERVLEAAQHNRLDFVVLADHASSDSGPLPAAERAGRYPGADGKELLVLVGVEFATRDGHLLGYGIDELVPARGRSGREVIEAIHARGGFAVVSHPFEYGGWDDWDAPLDGIEVHNNAAAIWRVPLWSVPWHYTRALFAPERSLHGVLTRNTRALAKWDELLAAGRVVFGFSGADAHEGVGILGRTLDPYEVFLGAVQTHCPVEAREPEAIWHALRRGRCWIRYRAFDERALGSVPVEFPSGRRELQLDGGHRVLELQNPILGPDGNRRSSQ